MNTRAVAKECRLAYWAGIMQERVGSGLSVRAFCEKTGFHENIYFYWQRKLRAAACEQLLEIKSETTPTGMIPKGFTEIRVSESARVGVQPGIASSGCLYIEVGGVRITTDNGYSPVKLVELLKGIKSPC